MRSHKWTTVKVCGTDVLGIVAEIVKSPETHPADLWAAAQLLRPWGNEALECGRSFNAQPLCQMNIPDKTHGPICLL